MSFLITGGTGFIGSYVVRSLLAHGEEVVCMDRSPDAGVISRFERHVTVIAGDTSDHDQLSAVFDRHPEIDRVVHLAYMMGAESEADPVAAMRVNAVGPASLFAEACARHVKRIIFSSSESVYGSSQAVYGDRPIREEDFCSPQKFVLSYSLTKLLNEHLAAKYEARYSTPIICLRPPIVFGHGRKRGTTVWASDFASQPAQGKPVTLPFPEDDWNSYIYVADLAEQIYQIAVKPAPAHRIYNTGGHTLQAFQLAALVKELIPQAEINFSPDKPHSPFVYRHDDQRIRQDVGCLLRPMREALIDHIEEVRRRVNRPD